MADGAIALSYVPGGARGRRAGAPLLMVWLLLGWPLATAQVGSAPAANATNAYAAAEAAYVQALTTDLGRAPTPDDAVWHAALQAADGALAAARAGQAGAPTAPISPVLAEALALNARVYGSVRWYSRAFELWDQLLAAGGEALDASHPPAGLPAALAARFPTDQEFLKDALNQLAFARYQAGDLEGARAYYLTLLDVDQGDPEALRWLARLAFEQGDTASAIHIWGRLLEVAPDDEGARFFLELSRERDRYGAAASEEYRAGIRAYEAGDLAAALARFEAAYGQNPEFADAAVWAARSAFEQGLPEVAEPYWRAALEADPADARSAWFLEVTRAQLRWGVAAANDFYAGQSAYQAGDLERAAQLFLSAAERSPTYIDAWVWAARSTQEAGKPAEAIGYWREVLRLDNDDDRARWFLQAAQQQLRYGVRAGAAYLSGVEAYQSGDVEGARRGFTQAVTAAPDFAAAWSYLGRLEFQVGEYEAAARAYDRAVQLEPGNDEYQFFADEARRLAQPR